MRAMNFNLLKKIYLIACIALFLFPLKTFPFEADISSVITPSRIKESRNKTSATISVINQKQLNRQKAFFVEEALRNLPGVYVQSSGTPGEQTFVRIRGADVAQILVLIDGVQVNSPWNGVFDFGDLNINNVERIEVLKGNQSALYGSDALGGVINIITKKGKGGLKSSIKLGVGNQGTYREEFNNQRGWERFNYSFSVSRIDSEGQYKKGGHKDGYNNTSLSGQAELKFADNLSLEYITRYTEAEKEIGVDFFCLSGCASSTPLLQSFFDDNWTNHKKFFLENLNLKHSPTKWWDYSLQGSIVKDELILDNKASPELPVDIFFILNTDQFTIGNQHNFYLGKFNTVTLGVEYEEEHADRKNVSPVVFQIKERKSDLAFYFQNILNLNNAFFLTAGFRADYYSDLGHTYNPKVSTAYRFSTTGTKIKGSWGTGFRSPTIQELFTPILGNPNLKPEKSKSYEAGVEQGLFDDRVNLELVYFHIDFKDLIERTLSGVDNVGKAKTEGIEFSLNLFLFENLDLSGNYTYQKAVNQTTGTPLVRPENIWNFNIFYHFKERLQINLDINIVGEKFDDDDFIWVDGTRLEGPLKGYQRVDLALIYLLKRWSYTNELKVFTKINNLLDQEYFENKGFKTSGINFFCGLELSF